MQSSVSTSKAWEPKRSLAECRAIMTAPGSVLELEEVEIEGVKYRSYKHIPKSVREQWLNSKRFGDIEYLIYQDERFTYNQAHTRVNQLANLFKTKYGCKVGGRIAIGARNSPEWVFCFASQLLGCAAVAINAWVPPDVMEHCITFTECQLVILDVERAHLLEPSIPKIKQSGAVEIVVLRSQERGGRLPAGMKRLEDEVKAFEKEVNVPDATVVLEDISTIFFTSGTTGLPKGVVGTQRQFITNAFNSLIPSMRAILRNGDSLPAPDPDAPQRGVLLSTPLFHATGTHSTLQLGTMMGFKVVLMYKWSTEEAIDLIIKEGLNSAGGIPFMASALISDARLNAVSCKLEAVNWGGGPASMKLAQDMVTRFGNRALPAQGYGATELSSAATGFAGEDFLARPTSAGLPCLPMDIKVVDPDGNVLPPGDGPDSAGVGEIYMRGVNRTNGYWRSEKATKEAYLPDGWFRTGDIGYVDHEGFVYILDRQKDIIIRGGENIASAVVENALYLDGRLEDVAVFALPDDIWGELVGAVVTTKTEYHGTVTEESLIKHVLTLLPKHCVPVIVDIRREVMPRNGNGKTMKKELKQEVGKIWEARKKSKAKL